MTGPDPVRTPHRDRFEYTPSPDLSPQARLVMNKIIEYGDNYVANLMFSRDSFMRQRTDKRRDVDAECGHPPTGEITTEIYKEVYDRNPIAARVVEVYPRECWQVHPEVYESEDVEEETAFEAAWKELGRSFVTDETDYFQDQQGSMIWNHLKHADELAGIGRYGVLLLGLADGQDDLSQPAKFIKTKPPTKPTPSDSTKPSTPPDSSKSSSPPLTPPGKTTASPASPVRNAAPKLAYLRAFPEYLADVIELETDVSRARYGQPTRYLVTVTDPRNVQPGAALSGSTTQSIEVHWTRVIHVSDTHHTASSSEWFAVPRMRPVFNNLMDLAKLYGGSAEMYWLGAFPGLAFKAVSEEGMTPAVNDPMLKAEIENYMHGLQRFLRLVNIDVEPLSPQVVDPTPQIASQLEAICVKIGMPKRIFMGSERGELASSQDDATWNERKRDRQNGWITPKVIRPFINRLIALGVLPAPEGYSVKWPDLSSQTAGEKADVAFKFAQSISQYTDSQAGHVMTPVDFLTKVIGMDEAEALEVTERAEEAARKAQEEMQAQQNQMAAQQGTDTQSWVQQVAGVKPKGGPPTPPGKNGVPPGAPGTPPQPGGATPPGLPGAGPVKPAVKGTLPGKPGVTRRGPGTGGGKGKPPFGVRRNANTVNAANFANTANSSPLVVNAQDGTAHVPTHVLNVDQGDGHWVTLEGGQHVFIGGGGGLKPGGPGGRSVDTGGSQPPMARGGGAGGGSSGGGTRGAGRGGADKAALKAAVSEKIKSIAGKGGKASDADVKELHAALSKMTVTELNALKKEHGLKASGLRNELIDKLKDRLLEKYTGEKQDKVKTEEAKTTKGAKDQAKRDASDIIARFKEGTQKENDHQELHQALSKMTGKELDAFKKDQGLKASGKNKQELADKLKDRFVEKFARKEQEKKDKAEGKTTEKAPENEFELNPEYKKGATSPEKAGGKDKAGGKEKAADQKREGAGYDYHSQAHIDAREKAYNAMSEKDKKELDTHLRKAIEGKNAVDLSELRKSLPEKFRGREMDEALVRLHKSGTILLSQEFHDPKGLPNDVKGQYVPHRDNVFKTASVLEGWKDRAPEQKQTEKKPEGKAKEAAGKRDLHKEAQDLIDSVSRENRGAAYEKVHGRVDSHLRSLTYKQVNDLGKSFGLKNAGYFDVKDHILRQVVEKRDARQKAEKEASAQRDEEYRKKLEERVAGDREKARADSAAKVKSAASQEEKDFEATARKISKAPGHEFAEHANDYAQKMNWDEAERTADKLGMAKGDDPYRRLREGLDKRATELKGGGDQPAHGSGGSRLWGTHDDAPGIADDAARPSYKDGQKAAKEKGENAHKFTGDELRRVAAQDPDNSKDNVRAYLRAGAKDSGAVNEHGMTHTERMREVEVDGVRYRFGRDNVKSALASAHEYATDGGSPKVLHDATRETIFTSQENKDDPHWRAAYNNPNHVSIATGGNGKTVVYNNATADKYVRDHESGHNLATKLWGGTHPDLASEYGKAQMHEKPVTEYGSKSRAEDFAEATRLYADKNGRKELERDFPMKHAALKKIMGE